MNIARGVAMALVMALLLVRPAFARDLTGIYVASQGAAVVYFNLTDVNGQLTGYVQVVAADSSQRDGVSRKSTNVMGIVSGSRLVFNVNGGQWTADLTGSGFVANIPLKSGQIQQVEFRLSSIAQVNQLVANITNAGTSAKYYANAQAELSDSETRLSNDINVYRPRAIAAIQRAKKELAKGQAEQARANENLANKKAIAAQKHADANAAMQSAQTGEESAHAGELSADAGSADADVGSAQADVASANVDEQSAENDLRDAENDLAKIDARIAQLRQIISRDKSALGIH